MTMTQVVFALGLLNIVQAIGWAYTLRRSMDRCLHMYEFGRVAGVEQGVHRGRMLGPVKKRRRKR
jgi:hypothetical protein